MRGFGPYPWRAFCVPKISPRIIRRSSKFMIIIILVVAIFIGVLLAGGLAPILMIASKKKLKEMDQKISEFEARKFASVEDRLTYSKVDAFRTADSLSSTRIFEEFSDKNFDLVDPRGLEPLTSSMPWMRSTR